MTLSDLVPSLDTCRAFTEVVPPQFSSLLAWYAIEGDKPRVQTGPGTFSVFVAWAPTLAEVLAVLPRRVYVDDKMGQIEGGRSMDGTPCWAYVWRYGNEYHAPHREFNASEAEAAARLYLSLHAAGLLSGPEAVPTGEGRDA